MHLAPCENYVVLFAFSLVSLTPTNIFLKIFLNHSLTGNAAYFLVWPWLLCSFPSDPLLRRISSFYLWRDLGKLGRGVKRWQWWSGLTGSGLVNTQPPPSLPHLPHHSQADVMQPAMVVAPCNPSPTISVAGHHTTIPSEGNPLPPSQNVLRKIANGQKCPLRR